MPEREKLYVDAIAALYLIDYVLRTELQSGDAARVKKAKDDAVAKNKEKRDEKKLRREFLRGLEAVVAACPDDIEAKAFLAIQSWRNEDHGIAISSHGAVDALLDQVFAKAPRHPAHHYRVHLWDDEKAARALASAAALGDSAPGIAHQWHMAGHIYAELNRHAEAAWQQEASGRVDHAHMQSRPRAAVPDPQLRAQPGVVGAQLVVRRPRRRRAGGAARRAAARDADRLFDRAAPGVRLAVLLLMAVKPTESP